MRQRTIVCPVIRNESAYLLCKMPSDRGVFPGQWALSGGGMEPGEAIEDTGFTAGLAKEKNATGENLEKPAGSAGLNRGRSAPAGLSL